MKNVGSSKKVVLFVVCDLMLQPLLIQNDALPIPIKPKHIERSAPGTKTTEYKRFTSPVPSSTTPTILAGEVTATTGEAKETEAPAEGADERESEAASCRRSSKDDIVEKEKKRSRNIRPQALGVRSEDERR